MGFVSFSLLGVAILSLAHTCVRQARSMQVWTLKQVKPPAGEHDHHHH
jgi:hypothetical protein